MKWEIMSSSAICDCKTSVHSVVAWQPRCYITDSTELSYCFLKDHFIIQILLVIMETEISAVCSTPSVIFFSGDPILKKLIYNM